MKHIIFDLDNTLCDYRQAKADALAACFGMVPEHREALARIYAALEPPLFDLFADGHIPKRQYRVGRFYMLLELLEIPDARALARRMNQHYVEQANTRINLFDDVRPALIDLGKRYHLHLLTNGPTDGQRRKIEALGIVAHFEHIFISEEIGAAKPDPRAFQHALAAIGCEAAEAVMIGDSLHHDVQPAREIGMRAYHLSRWNDHGFISLETLIEEARL